VEPDAIYLVLDVRGRLWARRPYEGKSAPLQGGARAFLKRCRLETLECRLPGDARHLSLIEPLYSSRLQGRLRALKVCTPTPDDGPLDGAEPEVALCRMSTLRARITAGGWHDVTAGDVIALRLAALPGRPGASQRAAELVRQHPVYAHASFACACDRALGGVVGAIVDPRYFAGYSSPEPDGPLRALFGLTHSGPCALQTVLARAVGLAGGARPSCDYFQRVALLRGEEAALGHFLDYLVQGWLDCLSVSHKGRLFVPGHFFAGDSEAAHLFRSHRSERAL